VVTLGSNPNYDVTKHDGSLTIGKASASVTANDKSKTYGQANPAFDAAVTGTVNRRRAQATRWRQAADQTTGVGSYPIVVTLGSNPNYDVTKHDGSLTIGKASASVTANDKSKTYGQANPAFDAVVTGAVNNDVLAYTLATAADQTTGVGSYPIVVTLGSNPNYEVTKHDGTLTIGKASASVTANDKSKTYGQANPAFDAVVTGAVNGDALAYSLATAADQTTGVGSYPIVVTLGSNPNYDVTKHDGTLTIGKATASVTANDKSKTYGQANPAFDAVVTGAVNGDALAYSLATAADQTTGVGSYPIVVTLGSNPNYEVTKHDGTLTIGKASASVTANDKSKTYGQANPAFDAVVTGAVNNDVLAYTLATAADQTSGVGSYPIVVTLGSNPNYEVTKHDGTLTIGKASASVTANDKSKTYGQANPAFDAVVTGAVNNDVLAYTLATAADQTSGVGSYPIVVTVGSNPNYDVTKHDGTLTIGKASASVTANDKSKTYGQANPAFDAAVTGTVNNDVLSYTLATAADQTDRRRQLPDRGDAGQQPELRRSRSTMAR
jgi:stress response protein SCP2